MKLNIDLNPLKRISLLSGDHVVEVTTAQFKDLNSKTYNCYDKSDYTIEEYKLIGKKMLIS